MPNNAEHVRSPLMLHNDREMSPQGNDATVHGHAGCTQYNSRGGTIHIHNDLNSIPWNLLITPESLVTSQFLIFVITSGLQESDQIRSVAQLCLTLWDPMNCSTPDLPVRHQLPEFTHTHVHRISDAIQPSHPLSSPSPPAPNPSQHQSLFQ